MSETPSSFERLAEERNDDFKRIYSDLIKQIKYLRRPIEFIDFLQGYSGEADELSRFLLSQTKLTSSSFDYSMSRAANRGDELYHILSQNELNERSVNATQNQSYDDTLGELPSHVFNQDSFPQESNRELRNSFDRANSIIIERADQQVVRETIQERGLEIISDISMLLRSSAQQYDMALQEEYDLYITDGGRPSLEFIVVLSLWGAGALAAIAWDGSIGNFGSIPTVLMTGSAFYVAARDANWTSEDSV